MDALVAVWILLGLTLVALVKAFEALDIL